MQTASQKIKFGARQVIYLVLILGFVTAIAAPYHPGKIDPVTSKPLPAKKTVDAIAENSSGSDKRTEESKKAFLKAYTVFMHPRCMNCHPSGDIPLQGDDSHPHAQGVLRGLDGKGLYALKCKNCHQDANIAGINMPPGSPEWHLPPADKKMVFQGCTPKQLALHFKDNNFTGFKKITDMIEHVEKEPLVLNSFVPIEGRSKIPMSHEEFVASVKEWIEKGAAVPDK